MIWWLRNWFRNIYYGNADLFGRPLIFWWWDLQSWWYHDLPFWWKYNRWWALPVAIIAGLILCRLILPRMLWRGISRMTFHWMPLGLIVYAIGWGAFRWLPYPWTWIVTGGAGFPLAWHIFFQNYRMNETKQQFYAGELLAYNTRRKKILEEFTPSVVHYTHEESVDHGKNIAWFEGDGPHLRWFMFPRRKQRRIIRSIKGKHPTMDAHLDIVEQHLAQRRDDARAKAPEYAAFLNGYARLLIKFKPGTLPASDDLWVECADGQTRSAHLLSENGHEWAVNFLAGHLRWRSDWHDAFAGCPKCNKGIVQNRREAHYCTCVDAFKAKVRQSADIDVLRHIRFQADKLPAWMYDVIEAEIDVLRRYFFNAENQHSPTEMIAQIETLLTDRYIEHVRNTGGVILGYPLTLKGVSDASYSLPIAIFPRHLTFHGHLLGSTGAGKSTWLQFRFTQHFHQKDRGVIVISPERDLFANRLGPYIPRDRWDDVIYINPKRASICFNPFHAEPGEDLDDKATEVCTVLKRMMKTPLGERMEPLFDEAVTALTYMPEATIFSFIELLDPQDSSYRARVVRCPNLPENTRRFWEGELDPKSFYKASYENVKNRLRPLYHQTIAKFLGRPTFSWDKELNQHARIILIDLSDITEGTQLRVVAQLLIGQIQQTLMHRDGQAEETYIPYSMCIDEFTEYANLSPDDFATMFRRVRKYQVDVTPSYQVTASIDTNLLNQMIGNVGTKVALRLAPRDAKMMTHELQFLDEQGHLCSDRFPHFKDGQGGLRTPEITKGVPFWIPIPGMPLVPKTPDYSFAALVAHSEMLYGKPVSPEQPPEILDLEDAAPIPEPPKAPPTGKRPRGRPRKDSTKPQPAAEEWIEEGL